MGMTILVDNGTYALENMGDVCMLQACVSRLRDTFPGARVGVFTRRPERLARYCPEAFPVDALGRDYFVTSGSILGKLHRVAPGLEAALRRSAPVASARVVLARGRRRKLDHADVPAFAGLLRSADLVVTAGGGYITDEFPWLAERVLRTVQLAQDMGKRTAMLGQGLGPLETPKLRTLAARVLRRLDLLTLREGRANFALLNSLGVSPFRATVTGDDAIEPSRANVPAALGNGIGVNLRVTRYAGAGDDTIAALRPILQAAAARRNAALVPVPISFNDHGEDVRVLRVLLDRPDIPDDDAVRAPAHSVAAAASCRVVVTGAYHAAVFALSNGVPVVALAGSQYYVNKFEGLRDQFDGGFDIVRLNKSDWTTDLPARLDDAWENAESKRHCLLHAAARQVTLARDAYAGMRAWFPPTRQPLRAA
jgi:colanic acid/amylovoran biosynthesis protein